MKVTTPANRETPAFAGVTVIGMGAGMGMGDGYIVCIAAVGMDDAGLVT
ncbi:hypothetical protein C8J40_104143 [Sphingomonas sp. PP-CC-3A-396]|nr:hypothetical protein C8J40_104143 [Sphingomonas sp. PP-CC-3A-396]